jgi:hypothetical protein
VADWCSTNLTEQEDGAAAYACDIPGAHLPAARFVEAMLDVRQPKGLRLAEMLGNGPLGWEEQRGAWRFCWNPCAWSLASD